MQPVLSSRQVEACLLSARCSAVLRASGQLARQLASLISKHWGDTGNSTEAPDAITRVVALCHVNSGDMASTVPLSNIDLSPPLGLAARDSLDLLLCMGGPLGRVTRLDSIRPLPSFQIGPMDSPADNYPRHEGGAWLSCIDTAALAAPSAPSATLLGLSSESWATRHDGTHRCAVADCHRRPLLCSGRRPTMVRTRHLYPFRRNILRFFPLLRSSEPLRPQIPGQPTGRGGP
ncbi:hypothetical protein B0T25DRAFT_148880 [Lasiosphaeria hispida]|uniref:Uncharacterized protein n=1 Tax=Lasiosphaeria hispida TaxID=260671 RepID=A0AAJ0MG58_9PEZI|nr:hypothetical protein B0T25DRAFT_148880 [Lasiosphaeria hispida]